MNELVRRPGIGLLPLLVIPALAVNLLTFLWPMLNLAGLAFREGLPGGGIGTEFSLATWAGVIDDDFYLEILVRSVLVSLGITGATLLVSYPLAYFVHRAPDRWRNLLVVACISPLLISAVVRTYGWLVILGDQGFLPSLLRGVGVAPPRMMFNQTGVVVGLVEILMPYMILSLLAGFGRLSDALEEAAASLGAPPATVFRRIVLPLTLPGILLGCLLTFVLAISSFITPKLLGGGRVILLATEIYDQAIVTLNWPVAAALSLIALGVFGLALVVYGRVARTVERAIA
jgi:putative spermidine/putrescine transport system permease protein